MTPSPIDAKQRLFFEAFGFLVVPGLFADDIAEIRDAFDEVFADPANPRFERNVRGQRWHPAYLMGDFVERHERLDRLRTDPRITAMATTLLGPAATYTNSDGNIYCCETGWHFDSPTAALGHRHVKFLLYLDPLAATSGALRVVPATHHGAGQYQGDLGPFLNFDGLGEERTDVIGEHVPHWPLPSTPGDVIALDFRVMHASFGTTDPRRALAVNVHGPFEPVAQR